MSSVSIKDGYGPSGVPFMRFTLIYDGILESTGNKPKPAEAWRIRRQLDPQLRELWQVSAELVRLKENSVVPLDGSYLQLHPHHSIATPPVMAILKQEGDAGTIDLCAPIQKGSVSFLPLVRDSLALTCGLTIQFLRPEPPGRVYQGGDLDGRLKLLLDALSMPQNAEQVCPDADCPTPLYCVVENDKLVTAVNVQTERLLSPVPLTGRDAAKYVRLVITVDVRVTISRPYNTLFLGG